MLTGQDSQQAQNSTIQHNYNGSLTTEDLHRSKNFWGQGDGLVEKALAKQHLKTQVPSQKLT